MSTNLKRILIVDDEDDIAYLFALILEDKGYLVYTYNDPIRALAEFKANYYDVMILLSYEWSQRIRVIPTDKST